MNVMRDYMESSFLHWYYLVAGILSLREDVTPSKVNHHIIIQNYKYILVILKKL